MQSIVENVGEKRKMEFTDIGEAFANIFKYFDEQTSMWSKGGGEEEHVRDRDLPCWPTRKLECEYPCIQLFRMLHDWNDWFEMLENKDKSKIWKSWAMFEQ